MSVLAPVVYGDIIINSLGIFAQICNFNIYGAAVALKLGAVIRINVAVACHNGHYLKFAALGAVCKCLVAELFCGI